MNDAFGEDRMIKEFESKIRVGDDLFRHRPRVYRLQLQEALQHKMCWKVRQTEEKVKKRNVRDYKKNVDE